MPDRVVGLMQQRLFGTEGHQGCDLTSPPTMVENTDLHDSAPTVGTALHMNNALESSAHLAVHGISGQSTGNGKGLNPSRKCFRGVGVDGPRATLMPGVHRREQMHHLCPTNLTDDDSVGAHPHRLPHKHRQINAASALRIHRSTLQGNAMGVLRTQFSRFLNDQDSLSNRNRLQQGPQHSRLPTSGPTGDEE